MPLIIVESPTKAKTITKFLDKEYEVISSYGHVHDLPKSEIGIDIEHGFQPQYIVPEKAQEHVKDLERAAKKQKTIILATDADREGEAIAYHVRQLLGNKKKFLRIVFHEITPSAIHEALEHPGALNNDLVEAQKARRVLDRLVGYKLSPLLWKKIMYGLSAGRVQSVALRLIVEREEQRQAFKEDEYWTIQAEFKIDKARVNATLEAINGKRLDKLGISTEKEAKVIEKNLLKSDFEIIGIERKNWTRNPVAPFVTSTLQQAAANKFGFSASATMSVAQKLYETGKITYMRTDSTNMAQSALNQAQQHIESKFGKEYAKPSQWKTTVKLAQEAHEAIRPTNFDLTPDEAKSLEPRQLKLYRLIWQRALASQMAPASFEKTKLTIDSKDDSSSFKATEGKKYTLAAQGSRMLFDGFIKVYPVQIEDRLLPDIKKEDAPMLKTVTPEQHFTQPPARYSEATLIKALKEFGIGRPSTYAPTIEVIKKRGYVEKDENKKFLPTMVGKKVTLLLIKHFPDIVDVDFTARIEEELDDVAVGEKDWVKIIKDFYEPFEKRILKKEKEIKKKDYVEEKTDKTCPECASPVVRKLGRFGEFYSCSTYPKCKYAQQIKKKVGIKCLECKTGDMIERRTKKGKLFYGCSRYPKCNFASWRKPSKKAIEDAKKGILPTKPVSKKKDTK